MDLEVFYLICGYEMVLDLGFWKKVIWSYCVWWWLVMLPAWVCGSIGVVVGFGFVEGGPIVGGVAGVGVWVCCWWCCWCGCVGGVAGVVC